MERAGRSNTKLPVVIREVMGNLRFPLDKTYHGCPRNSPQAITDPDPAAAKRAFDAMMEMKKIDIAAIEAARRG